MRVAIDARAATARPSGVGIYTQTLISSLAAHDGANEYVLLSNRPVSLDSRLPANMAVANETYPVGNLWLQLRCPRLLRRRHADIFHGTNFLGPLRPPCPMVLTVHDLSCFLFPRMHTRRNNLVQRLLPAAIRRAARVIAISERTKNDLLEVLHVPAEKIRVVPNALAPGFAPVTDEAVLRAARERHGLPARYVLFVGTLEPRKNLPRLLEAFARFRQRTDSELHLVLAGEAGWGAREVHARHRELKLGDRVRFLGYIRQHELPPLYTLARAVVMPSVYEGFGLPAIEAMACGTPLLAANNAALAEVAGSAALMFPHDDLDCLADSLAVIDRDEALRKRLVAAGHERVRRYSAEQFARETLAVYREAREATR